MTKPIDCLVMTRMLRNQLLKRAKPYWDIKERAHQSQIYISTFFNQYSNDDIIRFEFNYFKSTR